MTEKSRDKIKKIVHSIGNYQEIVDFNTQLVEYYQHLGETWAGAQKKVMAKISEVPQDAESIEAYKRVWIDIFENNEIAGVIGVEKLSPEKIVNKGMVISSGDFITKLVEKPKIENVVSNLAISGRYVIESKIFEELEKVGLSSRNEIELTDALQKMLELGCKMNYCKIKGIRVDVGTPDEYIQANIKYLLSNDELKEKLLKNIRI